MYIIEEEKKKTLLETITRPSKHLAYVLIPCNGHGIQSGNNFPFNAHKVRVCLDLGMKL